MRLTRNLFTSVLAAVLVAFPAIAFSRQPAPLARAAAAPDEESPSVLSRVLAPVDDSKRITLRGNTHSLARHEFDKGPADPQRTMERIELVLRRSPQQEASLDKLIAEQYDPQSPNFHRWLEPEEFGRLYGPSDADIAAVTSWLENHGFQIYQIAKGRGTIEFTGTVRQVEETFHTAIHRYLIDGVEHIANVRDPEIPAALEPVVVGPAALHDFVPTHQSVLGGLVKRDAKTGLVTPVAPPSDGILPELTYTDSTSRTHEDVTPWDFAAMYNVTPLWNAGITGAGQKIAIAGTSDIVQSDLDTFRSSFHLPLMTLETLHNGADPGVVVPGTIENTADVEWSGAVAKDAQIVLVVTSNSPGLSMQYIVDNKVAPIMSASYGACESELGTAGNSAFNGLYKQGAVEGISIFISSGDQGATGCDKSGQPGPYYATQGLQVNGLASSPYVTAVGGTALNWYTSTNIATYWNPSNNSNNATAKGYIPELPWNSTCTSQWLIGAPHPTGDNPLDSCSYILGLIGTPYDGIVYVEGGSGGRSSCTTNSGSTVQTCGGGYAKPSWQAGVTGIPNDGKRDLPDVSLFASGPWNDNLDSSTYLICWAAASPGGCNYSDPSSVSYQEIGGTSLSSPAMAGIMALVVDKLGGKWQGLANPVFYQLAGKENYSNCGTDIVGVGNGCVFYDITDGNNAMVCQTDSLDCNNASGLGPIGVSSGYYATVGYDQATGLGSVNANNLVNSWVAAVAPAASLSASRLTFAGTKVGSSSKPQVITVKNTGLATLDIKSGGITITGADETSFTRTTTCGSMLAASGTCNISVTFKPKSTGAQTATLEIADNASGSPQKVALTGTGASPGAITLTPSTLDFPATSMETVSEAQTITVENSSAGKVTIKSISIAGANPGSFIEENNCGAALAANASCTVVVAFKPARIGALSGTLSVSDNATGSPQSATLSGAGAGTPQLKLSATALAFPATTKGTVSEDKSVTLTNTGATALGIASIAIAGANPASFTQLNTCPQTLPPAGSCAIYVDFTPTATGLLSGTLTITDNGAASPQTIKLTGTGAS